MRQTLYTEEIADEICRRIAEGEPLAQICRDEGMPAFQRVYDWIKAKPDFAERMEIARQCGGACIAHRTRGTARGINDGVNGESTGDVQRDKLIIDTDLKLLAKWHPKEYGDKIQQEHSGGLTVEILRFADNDSQ